jgi:hypothetical protein
MEGFSGESLATASKAFVAEVLANSVCELGELLDDFGVLSGDVLF